MIARIDLGIAEADVAHIGCGQPRRAGVGAQLELLAIGHKGTEQHRVAFVVGHEHLTLGLQGAQPGQMALGAGAGRQQGDIVGRATDSVAPATCRQFCR